MKRMICRLSALLLLAIASGPAGAEPENGLLSVEILSASGQAIETERYVAVVAEAQSWREPAVEVLAGSDEPRNRWSWRLPPGHYRV